MKYIVIHHSATKDGLTSDWEAIRKYHMDVNGWSNIGYHMGIERVADRYELRLGRALGTKGAHTKELDFNKEGIGICCVGNYDLAAPPEEMMHLLRVTVKDLMAGFRIPVSEVLGHREAQMRAGLLAFARKTCPGTMFDMDKFRQSLKGA